MVKLNPCKVCRGKRHRAIIARWIIMYPDKQTTLYSTSCNCGNQKNAEYATREEADAAWNSANPKEGKPNE